MRESTEKWLAGTPVEALMCREMHQHAWPRPKPAVPGRRRPAAGPGLPPAESHITWTVLVAGGPSTPRVLQRVMVCTACAGVTRTDVFVVRGERLVRTGKPKYKSESWYRRRRIDDEPDLEPIDFDVLRGSIITRLYPELRW